MAVRVQKKRNTVLVSAGLHPYYLAVIQAGFAPHEELNLVEVALEEGVTDPVDLAAKLDETVAAVLVERLLQDTDSVTYLQADICRTALRVEIEATLFGVSGLPQ